MRTAIREEFVYNYGEWTRDLAAGLWRGRARSAADPRYFDYPMLKRIATASRAVIVHNPAAARVVRRHAPDARIFEIPHLFVPPLELPDSVDTLRFRANLGLGSRTLLVGVFGHLRETKRVPLLLRAMQSLWDQGADARLLIAGAFASSDLERSITPLLEDPRILRAGHLPEPDFWQYAAAADLCVNLRFPTACESSGIAIRMMGIGKPVVFTSGEEIARIPENARLTDRSGPGGRRDACGSDHSLAFARSGNRGQNRTARAAQSIAAERTPSTGSRRLYWDAIKST